MSSPACASTTSSPATGRARLCCCTAFPRPGESGGRSSRRWCRPASAWWPLTTAGPATRFGEPAVVVGHDVGLWIAGAYALRYRAAVSHLAVMEAPLAGTTVFDRLRPRLWHFAFHGARDVAETLVAGRERQYLQQFFAARFADPSAVSTADFDAYVAAYASPGGMRAAFETYRTFEQDAADNRAALAQQGKLKMPVLFLGGELSFSVPLGVEMMKEVAEDVTGLRVPGAGHWIPEEQPDLLVAAILELAG